MATSFFNEKNNNIANSLIDLLVEANQEVPSWLNEIAAERGRGKGGRRGGGNRFGGRDYRYNNNGGGRGGRGGGRGGNHHNYNNNDHFNSNQNSAKGDWW